MQQPSLPRIRLRPRKAAPFWGRHPWVRDTAIDRVEGNPANGDAVDLHCEKGKWIARGIYNGQSRIRVRLYTWREEESLDLDFWRRRLAAAVQLRARLQYHDPRGACRLVYSEADGLSGLVVDHYAGHLVVQPTALAIASRLEPLLELLQELVGPRSITVRSDGAMQKLEGFSLEPIALGDPPPDGLVFIQEHGLKYGVQLTTGQKTGFYLDQRENRRVAASLLRDRRVLDLCCYTGGFGIAAAGLGGAREVLGIDTSDKAVALAEANAKLNGLTNCRFRTGDCFQATEELVAQGERFGAVIIDPPKFTQRKDSIDEALRAYHRLNRMGVELLEPGGILVTCSCSGNVGFEDFVGMLFGVALKTRREIRVLERRGAAWDHPLALTCPEGEYLKCLICVVGDVAATGGVALNK